MDWLLVVEDQDDLWTILQAHLRRLLPGVPLVRISQVIPALSHLQTCLAGQQPLPRLVLSNLYLPRREDGFHLLHVLKSPASGLSHLPVIMMSSSTDPTDEQAALEQGATFLAKPTQFPHWQLFTNRLQQLWNLGPNTS